MFKSDKREIQTIKCGWEKIIDMTFLLKVIIKKMLTLFKVLAVFPLGR